MALYRFVTDCCYTGAMNNPLQPLLDQQGVVISMARWQPS
jgi:hypothetical protein